MDVSPIIPKMSYRGVHVMYVYVRNVYCKGTSCPRQPSRFRSWRRARVVCLVILARCLLPTNTTFPFHNLFPINLAIVAKSSITTMAPWDASATISTFITLDDVSKASKDQPSNDEHETPVLRIVAETRSKGYDAVCLPITTDKWKQRWSEMCLLPAESSEGDKEAAARAAEAWRLRPGFLRDEVTMNRIGEYLELHH